MVVRVFVHHEAKATGDPSNLTGSARKFSMPFLALPSSVFRFSTGTVIGRSSLHKPPKGCGRTHLTMTSTKPFPVIKDHDWEQKAPYALAEGRKIEDYMALRGQ